MTGKILLPLCAAVLSAVAVVAAGAAEPSSASLRDPDRVVTLAVVQAGRDHFKKGNPGPEANFAVLAGQARQAAASKPDVIVFPEYSLSGWPYPSEAVIHSLAEPIPGDGKWYQRFAALARELRTAVVGNMIERDGERLYNTAFLIAPDGRFVGKYRKVQANLGEQIHWGLSQGDSFSPIVYNGVRYGISICSDMWQPETVRCEALLGADVILHQSIADDMEHIVPTRAFDSRIPIVMAIFQGGCYAVDAQGRKMDKLPADPPGWKAYRFQPFRVEIHPKYGGYIEKAGLLNQRNVAAYSILTDPASRPPWTEVFRTQDGQPQTREQLLKRFRGRYDANDTALYHEPLVVFAPPWTSPFRVDPQHPHHLVNREGRHLFILNKTAWVYFGCKDPAGVLDRARAQGVNTLRVALCGRPYFEVLGIDLWPWGGTRDNPDWSQFDEAYWRRVEERVRLAGEKGIGLDVVLYLGLNPSAEQISQHRPYWEETLRRLGKYANILTWEIANEHIANETFQDAAGMFFKERDPYRRPVCSSDGTSDDAVWPYKPWMDLAINHSCTSSDPGHDLERWYLAVARNTRAYGKPAFCNESGRENRHGNNDGIHRRKQGWLWCTAGCFWTYHSWEGCEGIDDANYRGPGQEFLKPMADFFRSLPFWQLAPNETVFRRAGGGDLVSAALATPDRRTALLYLCTRESGRWVGGVEISLRLPEGTYRIQFIAPADLRVLETHEHASSGMGRSKPIAVPEFVDDLAVKIEIKS